MSRDGILLVGGAGFIGTALARWLSILGRDVHILSPNILHRELRNVSLHCADLSDAAVAVRGAPFFAQTDER